MERPVWGKIRLANGVENCSDRVGDPAGSDQSQAGLT